MILVDTLLQKKSSGKSIAALNNYKQLPMFYRKSGFTFIELLFVMIVMAILSAITIPLYFSIIKTAKTVEAQQALTEIQRLEELYLVDNNSYSDNLSGIGFRAQLKYYSVTITLGSNGFIATATGNIDSDPDMDIWTIDERKKLSHVMQD